MSYNISTWKLKTLKLELPRTFDFNQWVDLQPERDERGYENIGVRWCKEEEARIEADLAANTWRLEVFNQELSGTIVGDTLVTKELDWRGEFSGHLYSDILLPLFEEFHGDLEAIVVWEGGDSVNRLKIHNGVVEMDKEIDSG
jgi:hypothetical protein